MRNRLAAICLVLEAFVVFFATLAAVPFVDTERPVVWLAGTALALACLAGAALVRFRGGLVLGSVLQVLVLATGLWVPAMFFLGAVFVAMWVWFLVLGRRIDADRAAWAAAEADRRAIEQR
ncbi:MAG: DUF4233 domain-containing protein [Actinomycetes bacterium]